MFDRPAPWVASLAILGLSLFSPPARADEPAPLVLAYAPMAKHPEVTEALIALDRVARRRGTAMLDLSPKAPPPPRANAVLRRGIESYHAFRYADALEQLGTGLEDASKYGALGLSPSELSDLHLFRALAYTEAGDKLNAWDDFIRAAVIDPTRQLDPARYAPSVLETYKRAVHSVQSSKHAEVTIDMPAGCRVTFDARTATLGDTFSAAWGAHYLHARCPGFNDFSGKVLINTESHVIKPTLTTPTAPTQDAAAAVAKERGAQSMIWVVVSQSTSAAPTMTLSVVDLVRGKRISTTTVRVDPGRTHEVGAALDRLIEASVRPQSSLVPTRTIRVVESAPVPWYKNPWVWGGAGVVVGAAILLPFVFDSDSTRNPPLNLVGVPQ